MLDNVFSWLGSLGNGRGKSLSVPVLDGALKPNNLLEEAEVVAEAPGLADLAAGRDGALLAAVGQSVCELGAQGALSEIATFDRPVTALAVTPGDRLAVGLGDRVILAPRSDQQQIVDAAGGKPLVAVTALSVAADGGLLICDGSDRHAVDHWAWDLMSKNRAGRVIRLDLSSGQTKVLSSGLAYAFGAFDSAETGLLVSESWQHKLSRISGGKAATAMDRMSGYPCRFAPATGGGFWLSLFSSRTQLVEFVLKENEFREEMMATIDPAYWISPSFGSGKDFLEPLQAGAVKQMGILKPWAPPRSYGLLVRYDAGLKPLYSLHSRVGGLHHGICAAVQSGDTLFVLSRGSGRILKLSVSQIEATLLGGEGA